MTDDMREYRRNGITAKLCRAGRYALLSIRRSYGVPTSLDIVTSFRFSRTDHLRRFARWLMDEAETLDQEARRERETES